MTSPSKAELLSPLRALTVDEDGRENEAIVTELSAEAMFQQKTNKQQQKHTLRILTTRYQERLKSTVEVCLHIVSYLTYSTLFCVSAIVGAV